MLTAAAIEHEIDQNYQAFKALADDLLGQDRAGQFALLRHQKIIGFFDSAGEAFRHGKSQFQDRLFSVQEVTNRSLDLGYFSHVGHYTDV